MKKSLLIHNSRCSKSRGAKEILDNEGIKFDTIDYLKDGLKEKLILHLPKLLGVDYIDMIRTTEDVFNELKLENKKLSDKEWVSLLMAHPILLQRPIFIHNARAVIARPSELVKTIL